MRTGPLILLIGLLLTGGVSYYGGQLISVPVDVESSGALRLTGVVEANQIVLAAEITGRVRGLTVDEGSRVEAGALVCEIDPREIRAEVASRQARVDQLESRVEQAESVFEIEGERTRSEVSRAEAELRVAVAEYERALAEQRQVDADLERLSAMSEDGIISRQEWEREQTRADISAARIRSATDRVKAAEAGVALARANSGRTVVAEADVEQARAQLEQERALLEALEARLDRTRVESPISGMVSLRVVGTGEVVRAGEPIATIVDLDDVWVRTHVEESHLSRLRLGQSVKVELASGQMLNGTVSFVAPEAGFATQRDVNRVKRDVRTFGIKVRVGNRSRTVHPGMTAYVLLPRMEPG